ncbi:rho GTPase-activating protein gacII-like [Dendropsophus ebraccatus]|uniref:rho GTPase-activating protein gacII-like n=1 Tax=Dendropsophus ebraccatus TaxID=150705 RepID=UPI003831F722
MDIETPSRVSTTTSTSSTTTATTAAEPPFTPTTATTAAEPPSTPTTATTAAEPPSTTTTFATPARPPRRLPQIARRTQRTSRTTDRELDVEAHALAMIQRVDNKDEFDNFGAGMASSCRRMRPQASGDFRAFCHAMATVFELTEQLPPVEEFIKQLKIIAGHRPGQKDNGAQTEVQSHVSLPPMPPVYHQQQQYHLPTSSLPQSGHGDAMYSGP